MATLLVLLSLVLASAHGDLTACPGEGRWGDHTCDHDSRYRVCAQLLDEYLPGGTPLQWGGSDFYDIVGSDFWAITGITSPNWEDDIVANDGDSRCIDMWATAFMVRDLGCENVHIRCDATDVSYLMTAYSLGSSSIPTEVWEGARSCLVDKCVEEGAFESPGAHDRRPEYVPWYTSLGMVPASSPASPVATRGFDPKSQPPGRKTGLWAERSNEGPRPDHGVRWSRWGSAGPRPNRIPGRWPNLKLVARSFPDGSFSITLATVTGLFVGSGVTLALLERRRRVSAAVVEPLLSA
jgi:hypothetical protein